MVTYSRQKRFAINMQVRHCCARAKPLRLKKSRKRQIFLALFDFQKAKSAETNKEGISTSSFKNAKLATLC